jgi:hypothetical protein
VAARSVELGPRAEAARTSLPAPIRRSVNAAIRRIVANPDWGAVFATGSELRVLAPGQSSNSGLIATLAQHGARSFAIVYRPRDGGRTVWIEDIREIFVG